VEKTLNEAAACFGINSNALGYIVEGDANEAKLCSIFRQSEKGTAIPAELFESYGTIRFINMFPLVVNALLNGGTLVVDEFDASIHPMALMNIINIFHNDEINVNHAQLIFNTHNPIFLNSNLYRRDEIKFVERNDDTHFSSHYSLSDFGTAGKQGVRKNEDYMKNYFVDRYGAIKDIDFTPIFEELMSAEKER
jgi:AAA15 family ATPase/GTPase